MGLNGPLSDVCIWCQILDMDKSCSYVPSFVVVGIVISGVSLSTPDALRGYIKADLLLLQRQVAAVGEDHCLILYRLV